MKRLLILLALCSSAWAVPTANSCNANATSSPTCTATLAVTSGDQLAAWSCAPIANSGTIVTPSDTINTYTQRVGPTTGNSNNCALYTATATTSTTITETFGATASSGAINVEGVIGDLGPSLGSFDSLGGSNFNTASTSTTLSITASLTATHASETIWTCAGTNNGGATSWTMTLSGFTIPTNGSVTSAAGGAACGYDVVSSTFSYTGGTTVFTIGTTRPYGIAMEGFYNGATASGIKFGGPIVMQ